jgi:hypothetical protein
MIVCGPLWCVSVAVTIRSVMVHSFMPLKPYTPADAVPDVFGNVSGEGASVPIRPVARKRVSNGCPGPPAISRSTSNENDHSICL